MQKDQGSKIADLLLLAKGQGLTNAFASKLDTQCTFELSQNLLVGNCLSGFVFVDLR
jgi:hypothetical protein